MVWQPSLSTEQETVFELTSVLYEPSFHKWQVSRHRFLAEISRTKCMTIESKHMQGLGLVHYIGKEVGMVSSLIIDG